MSDDVDRQIESSDEESSGPLGGERLAEARREQQISVLEIAKELHLDEPKVRALERNEFDVLGAPVFAKGHLRKYAQLVGVKIEDVLADYYQLTRSTSMPPVVTTRPRPRKELTPGPWIAVIVVIILAVTVYWWFTRPAGMATDPSAETVAPETAAPEVEPAPAEPISDIVPAGVDERASAERPEVDESEVLTPAPVPQAAAEPVEVTTSPEIAEGQMRVLLTYSGDCWTEISDATGRRLFFDLGKDGRTVELSGAEPFNVLFGNPGNVAVRVNGEDFELPPTNRPNRPMRLTISGS